MRSEGIARPVIAGNWKMNHGPAAARGFAEAFLAQMPHADLGTVVLFPPALSFAAAAEAFAKEPRIRLGVQNVHWEESGAFTGELSAGMAAEAGATFALVGHSERRQLFGETDDDTRRKLRAALDARLAPVLCVGETLEERDAGRAESVVGRQLETGLADLDPADAPGIAIAYEPVWAIGTGRTASPRDAEAMHSAIRAHLRNGPLAPSAELIPILYGGSVKPDNAAALLAARDVDGVLVGGASLDPDSFARICGAPARG